MTNYNSVTTSEPRTAVRLTFPDGFVAEAPVGTPIESFVRHAQTERPGLFPAAPMAAVLDGKLRELTYSIAKDGTIAPILLNSQDGGRVYRRSLVLLLVVAVEELFGTIQVNVSFAVPDGGFFCTVEGRDPFTDEELAQIEAHMHAIVALDEPISKRVALLDEAIAMFEARGDTDKVRLFEQRTRNDVNLYTLRGHSDYFYGYMVPSAGYLDKFALTRANGGFILRYPTGESPNAVPPLTMNAAKISRVFGEAEAWLKRVSVEDIGKLNSLVREDRIQELILVAEARHEQQIARIAGDIYRLHHEQGTRLILIAGPSSSGKTTFSKRLALQLLAHGLRPFTLELDNYFVDRELTPRDETGNYDFEALEAINLPLLNDQLLKLTEGETVQLPTFDFRMGKSRLGPIGRLTENQILICEGIHGMNPKLVTQISTQKIFRIYVSALTQLNIDAHNRIPTTDVRLLRRISRDAVQRGHNATDTINRWESVRRGEKRNIFPFQENADVIFNSTLVYELAALRTVAEPLLLQVEYGTPAHIEANRLLLFLRWVHPFTREQEALIPDTSLLREFIGASILRDYHPGDLYTQDV